MPMMSKGWQEHEIVLETELPAASYMPSEDDLILSKSTLRATLLKFRFQPHPSRPRGSYKNPKAVIILPPTDPSLAHPFLSTFPLPFHDGLTRNTATYFR